VNGVTVSDAMRSFVNAAQAAAMPGPFVRQMVSADIHRPSGAEFSAELKRYVSRAAAAAKTREPTTGSAQP
jgi:hypothetical protein